MWAFPASCVLWRERADSHYMRWQTFYCMLEVCHHSCFLCVLFTLQCIPMLQILHPHIADLPTQHWMSQLLAQGFHWCAHAFFGSIAFFVWLPHHPEYSFIWSAPVHTALQLQHSLCNTACCIPCNTLSDLLFFYTKLTLYMLPRVLSILNDNVYSEVFWL